MWRRAPCNVAGVGHTIADAGLLRGGSTGSLADHHKGPRTFNVSKLLELCDGVACTTVMCLAAGSKGKSIGFMAAPMLVWQNCIQSYEDDRHSSKQ